MTDTDTNAMSRLNSMRDNYERMLFADLLPPFGMTQPIAQGWECPRCGRIHAPHVNKCTCKRSKVTIAPPYESAAVIYTYNDEDYEPPMFAEKENYDHE